MANDRNLESRLTILNHYDLTAPPEIFTEVLEKLVQRVRSEGYPGVLSYRFFTNQADGTAQGIIDYDTPAAWIGHHDIAMDWPEMKALHSVATLSRITFLGPMTTEIRNWIANSRLTACVESGNRFAHGFQR